MLSNVLFAEILLQIYWKMTNLHDLWANTAPTEYKNHFRRTGSIVWSFLPCGRTVSVFNSGRGYTVKVHDNMTFRHRLSQKVTMGTVKKDTLCMDATAKRIAVGGLGSQKASDEFASLCEHIYFEHTLFTGVAV